MDALLLRLRRWGGDHNYQSDTAISEVMGDRNLFTRLQRLGAAALTLDKAQQIAQATGWSVLSVLLDGGVFTAEDLREYCDQPTDAFVLRYGDAIRLAEPWQRRAALAILAPGLQLPPDQ